MGDEMKRLSLNFAGIMYNVGSLLARRSGPPAWATTDAVMGVAGVALFGLFLSAGLMKRLTLYRILMGFRAVALRRRISR